jgi:exonuclease VII large subunit
LDGLTARYGLQHLRIWWTKKFRYLNEVEKRIDQQIEFILSLQQSKFQGLNDRLFLQAPKHILKRGYSIMHTLPERQIMTSVEKLKVGEEFGVIMSDGEVTAVPKEFMKSDG